MFDWIKFLWDIQDAWGSTWLTGAVIVVGAGLISAGSAYWIAESSQRYWADEPEALGFVVVFASAILGCFWPLVAIALPFLIAAALLFCGGVVGASAVDEAIKSRREES